MTAVQNLLIAGRLYINMNTFAMLTHICEVIAILVLEPLMTICVLSSSHQLTPTFGSSVVTYKYKSRISLTKTETAHTVAVSHLQHGPVLNHILLYPLL